MDGRESRDGTFAILTGRRGRPRNRALTGKGGGDGSGISIRQRKEGGRGEMLEDGEVFPIRNIILVLEYWKSRQSHIPTDFYWTKRRKEIKEDFYRQRRILPLLCMLGHIAKMPFAPFDSHRKRETSGLEKNPCLL